MPGPQGDERQRFHGMAGIEHEPPPLGQRRHDDDGLAPREADLTLRDLNDADELFVTNALIGIWPVARLDERAFTRGPATARLMQQLGIGTDA